MSTKAGNLRDEKCEWLPKYSLYTPVSTGVMFVREADGLPQITECSNCKGKLTGLVIYCPNCKAMIV